MISTRAVIVVVAGLVAGGCAGEGDGGSSVEPVASPEGVYSGTFPCDECPGIPTTLWLRPDGRFFIEQRYPAADGETVGVHSLGRWDVSETHDTLVLKSDGPSRAFSRDGPDAILLQTDAYGAHRLTRDPGAGHFESSIRLTGFVRLRAEGPLFTECLAGFVVPVAEGGDFSRFRHQYRSTRARGEEAFVEFEGRFRWSGEGKAESVTMDRFLTIREDGSC